MTQQNDEPQPIVVADMMFKFDDLFAFGESLRTIFRSPDAKNNPPVIQERLRCIAGLVEVARFLDSAGVGRDIANHFAKLAANLDDLERGIPHPLLTATTLPGSPSDSTEIWEIRGQTVIGLECYIRSGLSIPNSAKIISRKYPDLRNICQRGSELAGSLVSWRKAFLKKDTDDNRSFAFYGFAANHQEAIASIERLSASERKQAGDRLLERAVDRAGKLFNHIEG